MPVKGEDIVVEARKFLGVPFLHQGRTEHGLDCVGLVVVVANRLGISGRDFVAYGRRPNGLQFVREFVKAGLTRLPVSNRLPGHLIIIPETTYPCHVGIITGEFSIIHAHAPDKKVVETTLTDDWLKKSFGCMKWSGVTYG